MLKIQQDKLTLTIKTTIRKLTVLLLQKRKDLNLLNLVKVFMLKF
jgi:hypothetical protein